MNFQKFFSWILKEIRVPKRLSFAVTFYLISLMAPARKHLLDRAAKLADSSKSRFTKLLKNHSKTATYTLEQLSKRQARQFSKSMAFLANNSLPWKIAILIDSTLHKRSSLHSENVSRHNHGKGFVMGHQWTNIVLFINDKEIPLPPNYLLQQEILQNSQCPLQD